MKLSVKSDYAARAVLVLARHHQSGAAVKMEELAAEHGVPSNYLVQILLELKGQNIIKTVRGKSGGYLLARPPAEISLGDVIRCVHGQVFDTTALSDANCAPELRNAWQRLQRAVNETADSINFQQLIDEGADKQKMYYI